MALPHTFVFTCITKGLGIDDLLNPNHNGGIAHLQFKAVSGGAQAASVINVRMTNAKAADYTVGVNYDFDISAS